MLNHKGQLPSKDYSLKFRKEETSTSMAAASVFLKVHSKYIICIVISAEQLVLNFWSLQCHSYHKTHEGRWTEASAVFFLVCLKFSIFRYWRMSVISPHGWKAINHLIYQSIRAYQYFQLAFHIFAKLWAAEPQKAKHTSCQNSHTPTSTEPASGAKSLCAIKWTLYN